MDASEILEGLYSADRRSNVNHPVVKILFFLYFFIIGSLCTFNIQGASEETIFSLWTLFWIAIGVRALDFRPGHTQEFVFKFCVLLILATLPGIPVIRNVVDIVATVRIFTWLGAYVDKGDVVGILFYLGAFICLSRLYFMDLVWITNGLPMRLGAIVLGAFTIYFVMRRYIPAIMNESLSAARFKARLASQQRSVSGLIVRVGPFFRTLSRQAMFKIKEVVSVANTHIEERQIARLRDNKRSVRISATREDIAAIILLPFIGILSMYFVLVI